MTWITSMLFNTHTHTDCCQPSSNYTMHDWLMSFLSCTHTTSLSRIISFHTANCAFYLQPLKIITHYCLHNTHIDFPPLFFLSYTQTHCDTHTHLAGCAGRKRGRKTTPRLGGFCHGSVADFKGLGSLPLCQISFFSHPVCPHPSLFTGGR